MKYLLRSCTLIAFFASVLPLASAQTRWLPFGPHGGDARAFAQDPHDHNHIYLGTVSGTIFDTQDGGSTWKRVAQIGKRDDLVLDNIEVDPLNPNHVLVAAWVVTSPDGGLYVTNDGGKTWTANPQMKGHSIRSMTVAPSDPHTVIIGALDGVFRSSDSGNTWTLISPAGSTEIHEVESVAVDPKNPQIIYAGTWHLPWKTTDGGANWSNMKQGIIDDSDVFSIIVDPSNAQNVFLSACSGIYRSTNEGTNFFKVQGIPSTARRTRVLMQDEQKLGTVFAGTTEGLWRTTDSGHTFLRYGDPGWIINDVNIDPKNSSRVLLATDRTGVLISNDGGISFSPANNGFTSRQISAVTQDRNNSAKIYVGVINDKTAGGVFYSEDGGLSWTQKSAGLGGADIFSLTQAPDGTILAGTRHGIFRLQGDTWQSSGLTQALPPLDEPAPANKPAGKKPAGKKPLHPAHPVAHPAAHTVKKAGVHPVAFLLKAPQNRAPSKALPVVTKPKHSASVSTAPAHAPLPQQSSTGVYAMVSTDSAVFAATEEGVIFSVNNGLTWNHIRSAMQPARQITAEGLRVAFADLHAISLLVDRGLNFRAIPGPANLSYISSIAIDDLGHIWAGGREGVFFTTDDGATWKSQTGLFVPDVSSLYFDKTSSRVFVTANQPNTVVFTVHTPDMKVAYQNTGWVLRSVRPVDDHMIGFTPYDGVVIQPRMVVSQEAPAQQR